MTADSAGTTEDAPEDFSRQPERVRRMFADVASRYDLINHLLSFNIDRGWRRALRHRLEPALHKQGSQTLDLCCGTGDVLLDLQAESQTQMSVFVASLNHRFFFVRDFVSIGICCRPRDHRMSSSQER